MDPQATLAAFWEAAQRHYDAHDKQAEIEAHEDMSTHAYSLFAWLRDGGFAPDWTRR